jgi:hypothetical protein
MNESLKITNLMNVLLRLKMAEFPKKERVAAKNIDICVFATLNTNQASIIYPHPMYPIDSLLVCTQNLILFYTPIHYVWWRLALTLDGFHSAR